MKRRSGKSPCRALPPFAVAFSGEKHKQFGRGSGKFNILGDYHILCLEIRRTFRGPPRKACRKGPARRPCMRLKWRLLVHCHGISGDCESYRGRATCLSDRSCRPQEGWLMHVARSSSDSSQGPASDKKAVRKKEKESSPVSAMSADPKPASPGRGSIARLP